MDYLLQEINQDTDLEVGDHILCQNNILEVRTNSGFFYLQGENCSNEVLEGITGVNAFEISKILHINIERRGVCSTFNLIDLLRILVEYREMIYPNTKRKKLRIYIDSLSHHDILNIQTFMNQYSGRVNYTFED